MPLADLLIQHLQEVLGQRQCRPVRVRSATRVMGGHSNLAYRLSIDYDQPTPHGHPTHYGQSTHPGKLFIKLNHARDLPDHYASEVKGLQLLANSRTVRVPSVIARGQWEDLTYLVLEWIEPGWDSPVVMETLGRQLAALHRHSTLLFGLDTHGGTPWFPQSNTFHASWADFFVEERLRPLVGLAIGKGHLTREDRNHFDDLYQRLPRLFPEEPPALLHGDLWKGNVVIGADEAPYLVDPSAYYGHREMDLAMTCLFGGFDPAFYAAYNETYALQPGWKDRVDLWNLYPLLILTVLGPDYRQRLREALAKYL